MKPKTIVGLVLMAGFASLLFLSFGEQVGGYMNFAEAEAAGAKVHVVGNWVRSEPLRYDRAANVFTFAMEDEAGHVRTVRYANPKPANFEDAEQLVVEGRMKALSGGAPAFEADHILVKCPSKYNDARGIQEASAGS